MRMTLRIVGQTLIRFRDDTRRWIDVKLFEFDPSLSTVDLLSALIAHPQFRDGYIGEGPARDGCNVHGRWFVEGISPDSYASIELDAAQARVDAFRELEACALPAAVQSDVEAVVRRRIRAAEERFRLDADGAAQHEVAWVLVEFDELLLIRRTLPEIALVVMGID